MCSKYIFKKKNLILFKPQYLFLYSLNILTDAHLRRERFIDQMKSFHVIANKTAEHVFITTSLYESISFFKV